VIGLRFLSRYGMWHAADSLFLLASLPLSLSLRTQSDRVPPLPLPLPPNAPYRRALTLLSTMSDHDAAASSGGASGGGGGGPKGQKRTIADGSYDAAAAPVAEETEDRASKRAKKVAEPAAAAAATAAQAQDDTVRKVDDRIIADLLANAFSYLSNADFPSAYRVSKLWLNASRLKNAWPSFDVEAHRRWLHTSPGSLPTVRRGPRIYFGHTNFFRFSMRTASLNEDEFEGDYSCLPNAKTNNSYKYATHALVQLHSSWQSLQFVAKNLPDLTSLTVQNSDRIETDFSVLTDEKADQIKGLSLLGWWPRDPKHKNVVVSLAPLKKLEFLHLEFAPEYPPLIDEIASMHELQYLSISAFEDIGPGSLGPMKVIRYLSARHRLRGLTMVMWGPSQRGAHEYRLQRHLELLVAPNVKDPNDASVDLPVSRLESLTLLSSGPEPSPEMRLTGALHTILRLPELRRLKTRDSSALFSIAPDSIGKADEVIRRTAARLTHLTLGQFDIRESTRVHDGLMELKHFTNLQSLKIECTASVEIPENGGLDLTGWLPQMTQLRRLSILPSAGRCISSVPSLVRPMSWAALTSLVRLESLELDARRLDTDAVVAQLAVLPNFKHLRLICRRSRPDRSVWSILGQRLPYPPSDQPKSLQEWVVKSKQIISSAMLAAVNQSRSWHRLILAIRDYDIPPIQLIQFCNEHLKILKDGDVADGSRLGGFRFELRDKRGCRRTTYRIGRRDEMPLSWIQDSEPFLEYVEPHESDEEAASQSCSHRHRSMVRCFHTRA
jgi:hypothetical protein